jgi:hypothetical protein
MYMVYWIESDSPVSKSFDSSELSLALNHSESLRQRQRSGEAISFVTIASENPQCVGQGGVASPPPDYNWTKRRTLERRYGGLRKHG